MKTADLSSEKNSLRINNTLSIYAGRKSLLILMGLIIVFNIIHWIFTTLKWILVALLSAAILAGLIKKLFSGRSLNCAYK